MAISPNDILNKRFEKAFRGYDEDQVDEFLDMLKEEIERFNEENHLLMGQIMTLEEEIQTIHLTKQVPEVPEGTAEEKTQAITVVDEAKQKADQYISDAKDTAQKIIFAANRKAEEAVDDATKKIREQQLQSGMPLGIGDTAVPNRGFVPNEAEANQKANQILTEAKQKANQILTEAKQKANQILNEAQTKANQMISAAKDSAKNNADKIVNTAEQKAFSTEAMMNIQVANSKQRLESIQNAVENYKGKLETLVSNQKNVLDGEEENTSNDKEYSDVTEALRSAVDKANLPLPKLDTNALDALLEPVEAVVENEKYNQNQTLHEVKPPIKEVDDEKETASSFFDNLKVSGPIIEQSSKPQPTSELPDEKKALFGEDLAPQNTAQPAEEPKIDNTEDRYRQVLAQIRTLEQAKGEVKDKPTSVDIGSVNPVVDMTKNVVISKKIAPQIEEPVPKAPKQPNGQGSAIISSDDSFVERLSTVTHKKEDEEESIRPMSDEEKANLRDMLDDLL